MTQYKLVPVEPTPEMLKAADASDDEYTRRNFGAGIQRVMQGPYDHYIAMLDAAPEPDVEPVAFCDPSEPNACHAFSWPGTDRQHNHIVPLYTAPQPAKQPMTEAEFAYAWRQQTKRIMGTDKALLLQAKQVTEAAHGIGSLCDSGMANTVTPRTDLDQDNLLKSAKKLLKELDVLREAEIDKEDWMPVNEADDALRAAIAKVEGGAA